MKTIVLTHRAAKQLDALASEDRFAVTEGLALYATEGRGDVKKLSGREGYRLRVRDYRVIFDDDRVTILAIHIGRRTTTPYSKESEMKTQTITSPSGDELVVLARSDYDALVAAAEARDEDADDVAVYDLRKAELAAGLDARLPPEVSARLIKGESLLKALRNWRDVTQMHLASKTRVGQGYLSDLESGRRKGTPETLKMIAAALDVPAQWLVD